MSNNYYPLPAEGSLCLSPEDLAKVQGFIIEHAVERARIQGCGKTGGRTHLAMQGHYFAGAMAALHAMGLVGHQAMPPLWCVAIMSGDVITAKSEG